MHEKAAGRRRVAERSVEIGRGRAERSVDEAFHTRHPKPVVAGTRLCHRIGDGMPLLEWQVARYPHRQGTVGPRTPQRRHVRPRTAHTRHTRHADRCGVPEGARHDRIEFHRRRGGNRGANGRHGRVLEHAGQFAVAPAYDLTAGDIADRTIDTRRAERRRVGQTHMTIQAGDEDRMIGGHRVDPAAVGQRSPGPQLVVPGATQDPASRRPGPDKLGDPTNEFLGRVGVPQVDVGQLMAAQGKVHVVIDEAGHHQTARIVDPFGLGTDQPGNRGTVAHGDDAVTPDGNGLGPRRQGIGGPDGTEDDEIGRRRRPAGREEREDDRQGESSRTNRHGNSRISGSW